MNTFSKKVKNIVDSKLCVVYNKLINGQQKVYRKEKQMKNNNKLAAYRKLHNLKQEDVAKMLNMSKVSYSYKENGKREFSLSEAKTLADYFGVTIDSLFFNNEVNFMLSKLV